MKNPVHPGRIGPARLPRAWSVCDRRSKDPRSPGRLSPRSLTASPASARRCDPANEGIRQHGGGRGYGCSLPTTLPRPQGREQNQGAPQFVRKNARAMRQETAMKAKRASSPSRPQPTPNGASVGSSFADRGPRSGGSSAYRAPRERHIREHFRNVRIVVPCRFQVQPATGPGFRAAADLFESRTIDAPYIAIGGRQ